MYPWVRTNNKQTTTKKKESGIYYVCSFCVNLMFLHPTNWVPQHRVIIVEFSLLAAKPWTPQNHPKYVTFLALSPLSSLSHAHHTVNLSYQVPCSLSARSVPISIPRRPLLTTEPASSGAPHARLADTPVARGAACLQGYLPCPHTGYHPPPGTIFALQQGLGVTSGNIAKGMIKVE